jgi:Protein of unknown function (DUF3667)
LSSGDTPFCARCGERQVHSGLLSESVRRWLLTLRLLVTSPGTLLANHREGRRVGHVPPLTLFLTLNLVFFIAAASVGMRILAIPLEAHLSTQSYSPVARSVVEQKVRQFNGNHERFADRFDAKQAPIAKGMVILMAPLLAMLLWLMMPAKQRAASVALVLSLHTFAFLLLFLSGFGPLWRSFLWIAAANDAVPSVEAQDDFLWFFLAAVVSIYLTLSIKRGLSLGWMRSAITAMVMTTAVGPLLLLYRFCVFMVASEAAA